MANPVSLQPSTKNKKKIYTLKTLGLVITVGAASWTLSGKKYGFLVFLMDACNMSIHFSKLKDDS